MRKYLAYLVAHFISNYRMLSKQSLSKCLKQSILLDDDCRFTRFAFTNRVHFRSRSLFFGNLNSLFISLVAKKKKKEATHRRGIVKKSWIFDSRRELCTSYRWVVHGVTSQHGGRLGRFPVARAVAMGRKQQRRWIFFRKLHSVLFSPVKYQFFAIIG